MKQLFILILSTILTGSLTGVALPEPVVITHHEMKEDGKQAVLTIGLETPTSIQIAVTGVTAEPDSLFSRANTYQVIQITIMHETRDGYVRLTV